MGDKKNTDSRDARGVRKQTYKRYQEGKDYAATDAGQTAALCDLMRRGIFGEEETEDGQRVRHAGGRPRKIETVEELREGIERYINYIETQAAAGVSLIPDVEGLALFLGVSRSTLFEWQKSRPGEFSDTLKSTMNAIAAYKKQLALTGKIPPIVFATDFNNNHGYIQQHTLEVQAAKKLEELPDKSDIVRRLPPKAAGSVIDSDIDINLNNEA
jgi:hypothetical protein